MHKVKAHGAQIPAIGLGTWTLKDRHATEMVEAALEAGYRHVDTARSYGNEAEVGAGLKASNLPRDEIFVTTKIWWTDLAPANLRRSAEASLTALGLDAVDLLLIHWPNPAIPLEGTIETLNEMRSVGLARHIGVSNFPTALLHQALAISEAPLVANQVEYHPYLDQTKVLAACREAGMAMVSYCPLHRGGGLFEEEPIARAARRLGRTPAQVLLRWHVQQQGVVAIPRTTRRQRLAENIAVFDFELSDVEMTAISALAGKQGRICQFDFSPEWDD